MCGLAGAVHQQPLNPDLIAQMTRQLAHRGPDGEGVWLSADGRVGLGHRRLAIVGLGDDGQQPCRRGALTLVFNGEIYNYQEIAQTLAEAGVAVNGGGDTQVLAAAWETWGSACLARLQGMFALAVYDAKQDTLTLARDRFGVKPLYIWQSADTMAFASEARALDVLQPSWSTNPSALRQYLRYGFIPGNLSIREGVQQLPAGGLLHYDCRCARSEQSTWYHLSARNSVAIDDLPAMAETSVRARMISERPVGLFLSGGYDSSLIAALLSESGLRPRAYSIGFAEPEFDESAAAEAIAAHLGLSHRVIRMDAQALCRALPQLPQVFDEPFADAAALPLMLLCQSAVDEVAVALSGEGGDELAAGYHKHALVARTRARLPGPVAKMLARALRHMPNCGPRRLGHLPLRAEKLADLLDPSLDVGIACGRLDGYLSHFDEAALLGDAQKLDVFCLSEFGPKENLARATWFDLLNYLPSALMTKADRCGMAYGLELREPLLGHHLVESALGLPDSQRWHNGRGKYWLRELAHQRLPRALLERPKRGFRLPLSDWLNGSARHLLTQAVDELPEQFGFDRHLLQRWKDDFHRGDTRRLQVLWHLICLHGWARCWQK